MLTDKKSKKALKCASLSNRGNFFFDCATSEFCFAYALIYVWVDVALISNPV